MYGIGTGGLLKVAEGNWCQEILYEGCVDNHKCDTACKDKHVSDAIGNCISGDCNCAYPC